MREDRRHVNEDDLKSILDVINIPLNLEIAANPEMIAIANKYKHIQYALFLKTEKK